MNALLNQFNSLKTKYPEAIILIRVGDFYETFKDDAILVSKVLGIVLTRRALSYDSFIPVTGFTFASFDINMPKLVRAGHKVAICDPL